MAPLAQDEAGLFGIYYVGNQYAPGNETDLQAPWFYDYLGAPSSTQRVVHAAQHLHGGMGVDRDYPLHRYFLWAKQIELTLGSETPQLLKLGAMLGADPV